MVHLHRWGEGPLLAVGVWTFLLVTDQIIRGQLLPGDFIVVLGLFGAVAGASITFGRLWVDFQNNAAGARRVLFLIDLPGDDDATALRSPRQFASRTLQRARARRLREGIAFDDVGLVYSDGRQALHGVSFDARMGQIVALVGPTGAGKTSLAYLVPGFLQPTSGRVLFDGVDAREIDPNSIRDQVSYVARRMGAMLIESVWSSEDAVEGARAFAEKRPPAWRMR